MRKLIIPSAIVLMLSLCLSECSFATGNPNGWDKGMAVASSHQNDAENAVANGDPNDVPGYEPNPSQTQYYDGVEQSDASGLEDAALDEAIASTEGQAIVESFNSRPWYEVDTGSEQLQNSELIVNDAYNISNGISDEYVDCEATHEDCTTQTEEKTCTTNKSLGNQSCIENYVIDIDDVNNIDETIHVKYEVGLGGDLTSGKSSTYTVDLATGQYSRSGNAIERLLSVSPLMTDTSAYAEVTLNTIAAYNNDKMANITIQSLPDVDHPSRLVFSVSLPKINCKNSNCSDVGADIQLHYVTHYTIGTSGHWTNDCDALDSLVDEGTCSLTSNTCLDGPSTKTISGVEITQSCWTQQNNYSCDTGEVQDTCTALQDQGCTQSGSQCTDWQEGVCFAYSNTYSCVTESCGTSNVVCGGDYYCMGGDCTDKSYDQSESFDEAMSALNADAEAQTYDVTTIFKGDDRSCRKDAVDYNNCCKDSGWGQDIGLASCSDEEKELGESKESGLAVYVGEYCSYDVLGVCMEHSKSYCVFQSTLSRILQTQGRQDQLGISFGSGEHPNCRGLTADELAQIDFAKIDWTDYYAELDSNADEPDMGAEEDRIEDEINNFYNSGTAYV